VEHRNLVKTLGFIWLIILFSVYYIVFRNLILPTQESIRQTVTAFGPFAPVIYLLLHIVRPLTLFSATIFSISAGVLFGPFWGTVYTVIGATMGATVAFLVSRRFGRDTAERFLKGRLKGIDDFSEKHGLMTTLVLRLVPGPPFDLLNYGLGFSKISLRDYVVGTFFGIIPGAFAYVYLGASLVMLQFTQILSALIILALVIGLPRYYKKNNSNSGRQD
jgi:uncharacterized membrane protein YdjX (TVP38/TMEM64 family)